jgi:hypothetical protein
MREIMHGKNYGKALKQFLFLIMLWCNEFIRYQKTLRNNCQPGLNVVQDLNFKWTIRQMSQVYLNYLCLFEENINKHIIFRCPLTERTTWSDMFKAVNDYITSEDISWSNCVCADGAEALAWHKKGFQV